MNKLKNFIIGGGFLVVGGILIAYLEWRVAENVNDALSKLDIKSDAKIVSMDKDIQTNTTNIANNKDNNDRTQRQLEEVARILMQPPE